MHAINCIKRCLRESLPVNPPDPEIVERFKAKVELKAQLPAMPFTKCQFQPRPVVCAK